VFAPPPPPSLLPHPLMYALTASCFLRMLPMLSAQFAGSDSAHYYAVGTAEVREEEYEPSKGRVLLFQVREGSASAWPEEGWPSYFLAMKGGGGDSVGSN
jgi:hypothetical protein